MVGVHGLLAFTPLDETSLPTRLFPTQPLTTTLPLPPRPDSICLSAPRTVPIPPFARFRHPQRSFILRSSDRIPETADSTFATGPSTHQTHARTLFCPSLLLPTQSPAQLLQQQQQHSATPFIPQHHSTTWLAITTGCRPTTRPPPPTHRTTTVTTVAVVGDRECHRRMRTDNTRHSAVSRRRHRKCRHTASTCVC